MATPAALRDAMRTYVALSLSRAEDYRLGQVATLSCHGTAATPSAAAAREARALAQRTQLQEAQRDRKEDEVWALLDGAFAVEGGGSGSSSSAGGGSGEAQWAAAAAALDAAVVGRVKVILEGCAAGGEGWKRDKKAQRQLALLYRFMPNLSQADPRALAFRAAAALRAHSAGLRQHVAAVLQAACSATAPLPEVLQAMRQDLSMDADLAGKLLDYSTTLNGRLLREAQAASMAAQPLPPPTPSLPARSRLNRAGRSASGVGSGTRATSHARGQQQQPAHSRAAPAPKSLIGPLLSQLHLGQHLSQGQAEQSFIPEEFSSTLPSPQQQQQQQQQQQLHHHYQVLHPQDQPLHPASVRRQLPASARGTSALRGSAQRALHSSSAAAAAAVALPSHSPRLDALAKSYSPRASRELRRVEVGASSSTSAAGMSTLRYPSLSGHQGSSAEAPWGHSPRGSGNPLLMMQAAASPTFSTSLDFSAHGGGTPTFHSLFGEPPERSMLGGGGSSSASSSSSSSGRGSAFGSASSYGASGSSSNSSPNTSRNQYYSGLSDLIAQALAPTPASSEEALARASSFTSASASASSSSSRGAPAGADSPSSFPTSFSAFGASSYKAAAGSWLQAKGFSLPPLDVGGAESSGGGGGPSTSVQAAWQPTLLPQASGSSSPAPSAHPGAPYASRVSAAIALARSAISHFSSQSPPPLAHLPPLKSLPSSPSASSPRFPLSPTLKLSTLAGNAVAELALGRSMSETNSTIFHIGGGHSPGRKSPIQSILTDSLQQQQ